ncbi:MAG: hypothetical protein ACWA44_12955 [Thiotrichales bacterium]
MHKRAKAGFFLGFCITYWNLALGGTVLGNGNTIVTTNGNIYEVTIDEASKDFPEKKSNVETVFFRFGELTLTSGEELRFINNGELAARHLVSFVESDNPAFLDGTINTIAYNDSQLYLISQNGITVTGQSKFMSSGDVYLSTASGLSFGDKDILTNNTDLGIYLNEAPSKLLFDGTHFGKISFTSPNPGILESINFYTLANGNLNVIGNKVIFNGNRTKLGNGNLTVISQGCSVSSHTIGGPVNLEKGGGDIIFSNGSDIETQNGSIRLFSRELTMNADDKDGSSNSLRAKSRKVSQPTIEISATGSIKLNGQNSIISSNEANGQAPYDAIVVKDFQSLSLSGNSTISSTGGSGSRSGNIVINSEAGGVCVNAASRSVAALSSRISTSSSDNSVSGNITITAESLSLSAGGKVEAASSGFQSENDGINIGSAGSIFINVDRLQIENGKITNQNSGTTDGGNISINAVKSTLITGDQSSIVSSTTGAGTGGDINIQTPALFITKGGKILSEARSSNVEVEFGDSGSIFVNSKNINVTDEHSEISVKTDGTNAGNIALKTTGILAIENGASINTSATKKGGSGGNITITGLAEGALLRITPVDSYDPTDPSSRPTEILAGTEDRFGGKISFRNISVAGLAPSSKGININADAGTAQGVPGEVSFINASIDSVSGTEELPSNILDSSTLTSRRCDDSPSGRSNFLVNDQQGIGSNPKELISSTPSSIARVSPIGPKKTHLALVKTRLLSQPVFYTCDKRLR